LFKIGSVQLTGNESDLTHFSLNLSYFWYFGRHGAHEIEELYEKKKWFINIIITIIYAKKQFRKINKVKINTN
jgi:hypothetical protein